MTVPATFSDLETEAYIAARDAFRRSQQELAQITTSAARTLSTLDTELASRAEKDARVERVTCYLRAFMAWAKQNDLPGFITKWVTTGTKREPRWKGLLGYRTVPNVEQRAVLTQGQRGITSRGEFIYRTLSRPYIISIDDSSFDVVGFEHTLLKLLEYYAIPIPS